MRQKLRTFWAAGMLLLIIHNARAAETPITAPLEVLPTGHIAVQVKFNGKGPFRLVLDTGSPITFISRRVARRLGILQDGKVLDKEPLKTITMLLPGITQVKTIDVGGAQVKDMTVFILDHPVIEMLQEVTGTLDGIVGYSFFARFHTTIDYAGAKVSFAPVNYAPQDVLSGVMTRLLSAPPARKVVAPAALWGLTVEKAKAGAGVLVTQVYPKSAADEAGIKAGDRLTTIDGRWTDTLQDCFEAAATVQPGQAATVQVIREGKEMELTVHPRLGL